MLDDVLIKIKGFFIFILCFEYYFCFIDVRYIIFFVVIMFVFLFWFVYGIDIGYNFSYFMMNIKKFVFEDFFLSYIKEKNEDVNYEYEMMWDAEGGMYFVRKSYKVFFIGFKEMGFVERFVD